MGVTFSRLRQLMDKSGSFFSRENIHRAGWAAIVLVVFGFGLARLYDKLNPPPPLVVTVMESGAKNDLAVSPADINTLTEEMKRLRETFGRQSQERPTSKTRASGAPLHTKPSVTTTDLEAATRRVDALEKQAKRLADALAKEQSTALPIADQEKRTPTSPATPAATPSSPLARPAFRLPANVKGWRVTPFVGVVESACPTKQVLQGEPVRLSFGVVDRTLLTTATPLFVRIIRMRGREYELQIFERLYDIQGETNQLSIQVNLPPAEYELLYGFYLHAELGQEYPNFYGRECRFSVLST